MLYNLTQHWGDPDFVVGGPMNPLLHTCRQQAVQGSRLRRQQAAGRQQDFQAIAMPAGCAGNDAQAVCTGPVCHSQATRPVCTWPAGHCSMQATVRPPFSPPLHAVRARHGGELRGADADVQILPGALRPRCACVACLHSTHGFVIEVAAFPDCGAGASWWGTGCRALCAGAATAMAQTQEALLQMPAAAASSDPSVARRAGYGMRLHQSMVTGCVPVIVAVGAAAAHGPSLLLRMAQACLCHVTESCSPLGRVRGQPAARCPTASDHGHSRAPCARAHRRGQGGAGAGQVSPAVHQVWVSRGICVTCHRWPQRRPELSGPLAT